MFTTLGFCLADLPSFVIRLAPSAPVRSVLRTAWLLGIAGLAFAAATQAQTVQLTVVLPSAADMPRTLGEWESDPSVIQVMATNLGGSTVSDLRFSFRAEGAQRGPFVRSDDANPALPRVTLAPGESRVLLWDELVDPDALLITDGLEAEVGRDGIPEDRYQICAQLLAPDGASVSGPDACAGFLVYAPDPPSLVYPVAGRPVDRDALIFQWAPGQSVGATYRLTVVPRFRGQTVVQAIESNPVQFEWEGAEASYLYLPSDPPWDTFPTAVDYVWQVQQLVAGREVGRDEGRSRAEPFELLDVPEPDDPFAVEIPFDADTPGADTTGTVFYVGTAGQPPPTRSLALDLGGRRPVPVRLTGRATLSTDLYTESGLARARRPGATALLSGQVTATVADLYTLPLSIYLSTEDAGYQLPFNQIGFSPTFGDWATLHGGYFSTRFSELTLGDARLLGGGFELNPGPLRLALVSGLSQQAVRPDETGRRGLFQQRLSAAQLGVGKEGGFLFWLTALHGEDDRGSLPDDIGRLDGTRSPQENSLASARFALPVIKGRAELTGEVAVSAYSEDTFASRLNLVDEFGLPGIVEDVFTPRTSSRVDGAAEAALTIRPVDEFSLNVRSRYVGPGYQSLGAAQLEVDVFDVLINPQLQLARGSLDLSVGVRQNDVAGTRLFGTQRTIVNLSGNARPTDWATLGLQVSNYGLRSNTDDDTLRVENVSRLVSVTPGVQYSAWGARHAARVGYAFQSFTDENVVTGRLGDTQNHSGTLSYTLAWPSGLSLTTAGTLVRGLTSSINTTIVTVSQSVGYAFFDRKLRTSLSVSGNQTSTVATDRGLQSRLRLGYRLDRRHQFEASSRLRAFSYGQTRNDSDGFVEVLGRFSYSLSF